MLLRIFLIITLGFIAYGCMLKSPFKTMDDHISIIENSLIKSTNVPAIFREGYFHDKYYYRPLVNLSFMGEYHLYGLKSFFYNLDNLILHILNALLVFLLVSRLTKDATIGFWTGLLFVMHPIQWEAVCNIPGRVILMSAFFILSTFILFLEFYNERRWFYLFLAMITFSLGLLCKESAGVLPFVLTAYLCLDKENSWTRKSIFMVPFFIGIVGYLALRHYMGITKMFHADDPATLLLGFVTFLRSVITDLRLFLFPVDLHFDRCLPFFTSFTYPPAILAITFWMVVLAALFSFRQRISSFVFFLIFWFALELLPVSQLVAGIGVGDGRVSTAEHFLYLASIPVFIGMVMAFKWLYELNTRRNIINPSILKFVAGGFLVFLLMITIEQSIYASNEYSMIERSLAFEPNNPRLQGAMGLLSVARGDIPDAEKHFFWATKAEPLNKVYHISLGSALIQQGKWIEGLEQFVAFDPDSYKALVDKQEKLTILHIRQEINSGKTFDARGWLAIGIYYAKNREAAQAIEAFNNCVSLNPGQTDAWFNLGSLYEAQKDWPDAIKAYKRLLSLQGLTYFQRNYASKHLQAIENYGYVAIHT